MISFKNKKPFQEQKTKLIPGDPEARQEDKLRITLEASQNAGKGKPLIFQKTLRSMRNTIKNKVPTVGKVPKRPPPEQKQRNLRKKNEKKKSSHFQKHYNSRRKQTKLGPHNFKKHLNLYGKQSRVVSNSCIQSGAYRIVRRCLSCSFQTLTHHHLSHHAQCTPLARLELGRPTEARRGRTGTWPAAQGASSQASSVLVSFPSPPFAAN